MTSCKGNGECLRQCYCECFNEDTYEYYETCTCGHREHEGNCPSNCCSPVECKNYSFCKIKQPKWVSNCHNGMCMNCAVQFGRHKTTDIIEDCPVCLENKNIIILHCNHKICYECWYMITKNGFGDDDPEEYKPQCPLCRNINDWSKK